MSIVQLIVVGVGGLSIVSGYIWFCFVFYMTFTELEAVLGHLENSPDVVFLSRTRRSDFVGKSRLMIELSGIVTFPRFHSQVVKLSPDDLSNIPVSIKRKLAIMQWSGIVILVSMIVSFGIGKIAGLYR